ncbi:MAG: ribonuclease III [Nevskia sp.]|nr:ribonuclease III [Nevskia sp.]
MNPHDERLQAALGYRFGDERRLARALTHRSASADNNERLEYLGDALLNFVIADSVFAAFPQASEGDLSRLRATLVREEALAAAARRIGLGDFLRLGSGELKSGGYRRDSILADGLEAVIGAVHLDGGFDAARGVCLRLFAEELGNLPDPLTLKDPKTRLQELLQATGRPLPEYAVLGESGPPHRRSFTVSCRLADGQDDGTVGEGGSRRLAEQQAAQRMLERLRPAGGGDA